MKLKLLIVLFCINFSAYPQTAAKKIPTTNFFGFNGVRQPSTGVKSPEITIIAPNGDVMKVVTSGKFFTLELKKENDVVKRIKKKIHSSKKQKDLLIKTSIAKKGPAYYTLTQQMVDEHEAIDKAYESVTTNKISLTDPLSRHEHETSVQKETSPTPEWIQSKFREVTSFTKSIEGRKTFDLARPDAMDFACNLCQKDSTKRAQSDTRRKNYSEKVFKEENEALENIIKIQRAYHLNLGEPASMKAMMLELYETQTIILNQILAKCHKLLDEYGNDMETLITIIPVILQKERQRQLLGVENGEDANAIMLRAAELLSTEKVNDFIEKKMQAKDFRYIINPAPLLSLVRQSMLLGGMEDTKYTELLAKIIDNNRFEFQNTIDIKRTFAGKDGDHFLQAVFVSKPFYYMVAETPDCRLVLVPDSGYQTVFSKNRLMEYDIKSIRNSECIYAGPMQLRLPAPVIHLDFCEDTAQLEFSFDTDWGGFEEKWNCSYGSDEDLIKNLISEGYNNRTDDQSVQMAELVNSEDREKGLVEITSGKDPAINNLQEMKQHYPNSIQTAQKLFDFRQFIKRVPLSNFQTTIIQGKLNGKETHDPDDERFEYAWLQIKLDHVPGR